MVSAPLYDVIIIVGNASIEYYSNGTFSPSDTLSISNPGCIDDSTFVFYVDGFSGIGNVTAFIVNALQPAESLQLGKCTL